MGRDGEEMQAGNSVPASAVSAVGWTCKKNWKARRKAARK